MMNFWRYGIGFGLVMILFLGIVPVNGADAQSYGGNTATVLVDSLNIRNDGSLEGDVVGSLQKGTSVQAFEQAHGWIQIRYGELEGWVAGYYLDIQDPSDEVRQAEVETSEAQIRQSGQVTVDALRLREGPSVDHAITILLPKGEKLSINNKQGEWLNVSTETEKQGWVHGQYVSTETSDSFDLSDQMVGSSSSIAGKVIVIDPGHGGRDGGARGVLYDTIESELNLSTSFYLEQELIDLGANVLMTRIDNENKVGLDERVAISHKYEADAFVSVHYNSAIVPASGTIAFYHSQTKDLPLARAMDRHLNRSDHLQHNGIAYGEYHVLRHNKSPSILVELGFLSNASDEEIIRTSQYQKQAAKLMADALKEYFES